MHSHSKKCAVTALRDSLMDDYESARQRLLELSPADLKQFQRACMALQNLAGARLYALALRGVEDDGQEREVG